MRAGTRVVIALAVACALIAGMLATAPAASAQSGFNDNRVSFGGVNGETIAARAVGDQVWVGGTFTQAVDADLTTTYARANVAVFDFNTGDVRSIVADTNDEVKAIESDDTSTIWVGGDFTQIAGEPISYIAAFDAITGQIDTSFNVVLDSSVNALHYADGWLYLGGEFGQINGLYYTKMARVDAVTGALDTNFRPNPDATVNSIDSFDDRVYAAGRFEEVGKAPDNYARRWIAGFDADTGQPAGPEFPFQPLFPGEGSHRAGLWRVNVSPDGNHLYTGDRRNTLIQWNRLTGQNLWQRQAEGDIQAVATAGSTVYLGTHEGFLTAGDQRLLVALNSLNGASDDTFLPLMNNFFGVFDIALSQGALIAVGDFTTVKGVPSPHVAVFHGPNWNGATPLGGTPMPGDVSCDQRLSVQDALMIAQFSAGLRTQSPTCPLADPASEIGPGGDVNGDGRISVGDALTVAQCSAGLPNILCPDN